ncbi:unnamed protein product [Vicia faba]|uniref:Uncharacterized protein n=1 Tax=Vicia faba TaxID=3906 RepID=A0AAV1AIS4_VICFA|nr:unnamed protein product [Vicia faba]
MTCRCFASSFHPFVILEIILLASIFDLPLFILTHTKTTFSLLFPTRLAIIITNSSFSFDDLHRLRLHLISLVIQHLKLSLFSSQIRSIIKILMLMLLRERKSETLRNKLSEEAMLRNC